MVVLLADSLEDGWRYWVSFGEMTLTAGEVRPAGSVDLARKEIEAIRADSGHTLGFVRVIGRRSR